MSVFKKKVDHLFNLNKNCKRTYYKAICMSDLFLHQILSKHINKIWLYNIKQEKTNKTAKAFNKICPESIHDNHVPKKY